MDRPYRAHAVMLLAALSLGAFLSPQPAFAADLGPAMQSDDRSEGLRIHPQNPRYLTYNGEPFYVVGSGMESIGQPWSRTQEQWRDYLDMLHRNGFNRIRFFPWDLCWQKELLPASSPWLVRDAKAFDFDLTQFNPQYWDFVKRLLTMAQQRRIVVEYNLFDYCSLEDKKGESAWARNPLSALNSNGGALPGKKGKPDIYAFADYGDLTLFQMPFDASWPWQKKNQWYQQLYVKHTIGQLTGFPNIHWEIMNEQGWQRVEPGGPEWTRHWLKFLDRHDPNRRLRSINAADVYDEMPGLDIVCEHPIPFFHRRELTDPEVAVGIIAANLKFGKPVICDETGYFPPPASTEDEIWRTVTPEQLANERRAFWYAFVAGGHWTAVCWQDFQERDTHRWVRHLESLIDTVPYWKMDPHDELVDRGHCLALPNEHYVIYLGTGGKATLQLGDRTAEAFVSEWIDPRSGERRVAMPDVQGQKITFTAPSDDDWAICVRPR